MKEIPEHEIYNIVWPGMVQGICSKCKNFILHNEKWEWDTKKPRIVHARCTC